MARQSNDQGMAIRLARTAAGLSQFELAAKVGLHHVTIHLIESGKKPADADLAQRCLRACEPSAKSPIAIAVLKEARRALEPVAA